MPAISLITLGVITLLAVGRLFVLPVLRYFRDAKGLRAYPSYSWLSPLTDFRHCFLSSQGRRSRDLTKAHKERGAPILRIGPNALSFNHADAIKDIYGHRTKCLKDTKESILAGTHRQLFDVIDKADHARKRKLLSAAFATKNLENWEYKVNYTARRLVKAFDERCIESAPAVSRAGDGAAVDFNHWINLWTIEAINFIAISSKMDLLDTGTDWVTAEKLDGTQYRARYRYSQNHSAIVKSVFCWDYDLWPWVAWITRSVPSRWKQIWEKSAPWGDITYHQAKERLRRHNAGEQLDDFFSCLMNDKSGAPNYLDWGEIVAEVSAIIDAGAETTAIALSNIMELLIAHPAALAALRDELSAVLDDGQDDTIAPFDKVKDLPYLKACLDEGLRISPPTSSGLPRRTPPEGASILGEWIPGDTSVSMTIYGAHHDPSVYPDPESFKPERWLDPAERRRMEPYFIPFSAGARGCIGRNISYLEQMVILATIVHRYDFALAKPGFVAERFEAFNMICGPLPIHIWRRRGVDSDVLA